ncbi:MAG: RusA family crossover junction endodeoxyribonuclease [Cetobacterium sp.]|uniref:RusA family crossover junction endodeoxyribonuclease n=1 Tax=Cetobacterium sp. TaxID=2071632 RepID=UPI003F3D5CC7
MPKNRKQHMKEYEEKYSDIPTEYSDRIEYIKNTFKIKDMEKIQTEENQLKEYRKDKHKLSFVLYESPQTSHRGKARSFKTANRILTQIYVPNAKDNKDYMTKFVSSAIEVTKLICTEMEITIKFFLPTPKAMPKTHIVHCENELIRPIIKPDVDNVSKTYLDMSSGNIFLDDALVTDLHILKRYSIKPRVEIHIEYFGKVPNKYIFKSIVNSKYFKSNPEKFTIPEVVL